MHAQSGWDQEIDLAIAEYSTFFTLKTPGLFLLYVWVIVHTVKFFVVNLQ